MNIPGLPGEGDYPVFEPHGTQGKRALVNGTPYISGDLNYLLRGQTPYDSVARYSSQLASAVRNCLHYDPATRLNLDQLSAAIAQIIAKPPPNNAPGPLKLKLATNQAAFREGRVWDGQDPPADEDAWIMSSPEDDDEPREDGEESPEGGDHISEHG